jgi:transcriptional regulator with PAS, ATPase and Fis domain
MINELPDFIREFPGAITVCDTQGTILYMNDRSCKTFNKDGGAELMGENLAGCHPEPSRSKLIALLESAGTNTYTIEKEGVRKLIHQCPWYEGGEYKGLVELSLVIPSVMPHYVRK